MLIGGAWFVADVGLTFFAKNGRLCYLGASPKREDKTLSVRLGFQARELVVGADTDLQEWYISTRTSKISVNQPDRVVAWVPPECVPLVPSDLHTLIMRYAWSPTASEVTTVYVRHENYATGARNILQMWNEADLSTSRRRLDTVPFDHFTDCKIG
jgi:hypothetical protein